MAKKKSSGVNVCPPGMHIVKRRGHVESFDRRKVYASAYAACLAAHNGEKKCEDVADAVTSAVCRWLAPRKSVTAHQIYAVVVKELRKRDRNAAFMYETHMDIS